MIPLITHIFAREILDSRGYPTIEAKIILDNNIQAVSSVPSGTSIGHFEAQELRDNDPKRYFSQGVLKAIENINKVIAEKLVGLPIRPQANLDSTLLKLDGTKNKERLGSNAILAVSQAICKAGALSKGVPLYHHVADLFGADRQKLSLPVAIYNLINGGKHGAGNLDFQEFHVIPSGKYNFSEGLRMVAEVYNAVKDTLIQYKAIHSVGYEGGYAPNLFTNLDALETLSVAVQNSNYQIKNDLYLGIDAAGAYFSEGGRYKIKDQAEQMTPKDLITYYEKLNEQYNLLEFEDPFEENDWDSWAKLTEKLPQTLIIGDDLLATNKDRLKEAVAKKACNAILVKPNQIGTITESIEIIKQAQEAKFKVVISHRSGETNDDFLADFAVGVLADYVKFGAPARGERVAKYNRLLAIENELKGNIF